VDDSGNMPERLEELGELLRSLGAPAAYRLCKEAAQALRIEWGGLSREEVTIAINEYKVRHGIKKFEVIK